MAFNLFKKKTDYKQQLDEWEKNGKPLPPPHIVKQNTIRDYQKQYNIHTLVETGTYLGEMVEALRATFTTIYSVELSEKLYRRAVRKFKKFSGIQLLQGDSSKVLAEIITRLSSPAVFWLDGHYSGGITALGDKECPVIEELQIIFSSPHLHIILIDDARLFTGTNDYPTINELEQICNNLPHKYRLTTLNDIIRLTPAV